MPPLNIALKFVKRNKNEEQAHYKLMHNVTFRHPC